MRSSGVETHLLGAGEHFCRLSIYATLLEGARSRTCLARTKASKWPAQCEKAEFSNCLGVQAAFEALKQDFGQQ